MRADDPHGLFDLPEPPAPKKPRDTNVAKFWEWSMYVGGHKFTNTKNVRKLAEKMIQWCDYKEYKNR